jgi:hypothetical protein
MKGQRQEHARSCTKAFGHACLPVGRDFLGFTLKLKAKDLSHAKALPGLENAEDK